MKYTRLSFICVLVFLLLGCRGPIRTPIYPTSTPLPTYTPQPSQPTYTPYPTATPAPTYTPYSTATHAPTYTPYPTLTPTGEILGLSYEEGDWKRRRVDLMTVEKEGIPVSKGNSLELLDIWISASGVEENAKVFLRALVDDISIGETPAQKIEPGEFLLNPIDIFRSKHSVVENAWLVKDDWNSIKIQLFVQVGNQTTKVDEIDLKFNKFGASWFISPPYASLNKLVYSMNSGSENSVDFQTILQEGITLQENDILEISEIWVHGMATNNMIPLKIEAYLTKGGYDGKSIKVREDVIMEIGIFNILYDETFSWTVTSDKKILIITLSREDHAVLDRYEIPLTVTQ